MNIPGLDYSNVVVQQLPYRGPNNNERTWAPQKLKKDAPSRISLSEEKTALEKIVEDAEEAED